MRFLALLLSVLLMASMLPPSVFAEEVCHPTDDEAAEIVAHILSQVEAGNATEHFYTYSLDELSDEEIQNNEILQQYFSSLDNSTSSSTTYSKYTLKRYGTLYVYDVEDVSGNSVRYYLQPYTKLEYNEIGYNSTSSWVASFSVTETVYVNGVLYDAGIIPSEIKCKNIRCEMGLGENAVFYSNIHVLSEGLTSLTGSVNALAVFASLVGIAYPTTGAILSAFSSLTYPALTSSNLTSSTSIDEDEHIIGARFDSSITINKSSKTLKLDTTVGTLDSTAEYNTECAFAVKWTFDVYKGNSKCATTSIETTDTTISNYK